MRWVFNGLVHDVQKVGKTSRTWCVMTLPSRPPKATRSHVTCIACIAIRSGVPHHRRDLWQRGTFRLLDKHA